jgi:hypothetical protein
MAAHGDPAGSGGPNFAEDKRDTGRTQILGELHGEVMVFQPMAIKEISHGGAQIETAFPLHLDSLHDFRLTLGDRSVVVKARVAHCSITDVDQEVVTYRSGIEFVEPAERVAEAISGFIAAIRDGRRAQ